MRSCLISGIGHAPEEENEEFAAYLKRSPNNHPANVEARSPYVDLRL